LSGSFTTDHTNDADVLTPAFHHPWHPRFFASALVKTLSLPD
jgi:hypothetical protein